MSKPLLYDTEIDDCSLEPYVRYYAEDIGSLLAIANVALLLNLPGVQKELRELRKRCRARVLANSEVIAGAASTNVGMDQFHKILGATERQAKRLLKSPISQQPWGSGDMPTPQTRSKLRRDWLAMWRMSGQASEEEAKAIDCLVPIWLKVRKGMAGASVDPSRLLTGKVRKSYLQPLERLEGRDSIIALKVWLPWIRLLQETPAIRSNLAKITRLEIVESFIFDGASASHIDRRYGLVKGGSLVILRHALQDFYHEATKLVDNLDNL